MKQIPHISFTLAAGIAALLAASVAATAQAPPPPPPPGPGGDVFFYRQMRVGPGGPPLGAETFSFVATEMSFSGQPVKGAPYSAVAATEETQTLADGNHINHSNTGNVYRDSEGRTRRDQTLAAIGPWAAAGNPHQTIFINDPVAGFSYILDPQTKIARKLNPPPGSAPRIPKTKPAGSFDTKTESLGQQTIEGVLAQGTRTTVTIPAGAIGNELPIQVVSERWYSPDLQIVVMSKRNDPRMGQTTYQLTNISRSEPLHSLFEVPSDYTVKEGPPAGKFQMMRRGGNGAVK
ncbi:MAG TPA: hypothetical protein VEU62_00645 [Bryobacterales bacterium]|nr:hypothetical protein [Bryobacterales bacterium]